MADEGAPSRTEIVAALRERVAGRNVAEVIGFLGPAIAMLWAGVAIAGNVIAAGSKFTTEVARPDLLEVGMVQFAWTGYAEWALAALWLIGTWPRRNSRIVLVFAVPVALLLIQKLGIHPPLNDRTLATIAGEDVGDSPLHVIYGALEGLKIAVLMTIGLVGTLVHRSRSEGD